MLRRIPPLWRPPPQLQRIVLAQAVRAFIVGAKKAPSGKASAKRSAAANNNGILAPKAGATNSEIVDGGGDGEPDPGVELNTEQQAVIDSALTGVSLFCTGSGGTGKTAVLREMVVALRKQRLPATTPNRKYRYRKVAVTATTGAAAVSISAGTVHAFMGFKREHETMSVAEIVKDLKKRRDVVKRLTTTDTLVIDEISMLHAATFARWVDVLRELRQDPTGAGGMQIIVFGDFCQLPPVVKGDNQASVEPVYAFQTKQWHDVVRKYHVLYTAHRHADANDVRLLQKIRLGVCDQEVIARLQGCIKRKIDCPPTIQPTVLYSTRAAVDELNMKRLKLLSGTSTQWRAHDSYSLARPLLARPHDVQERARAKLLAAMSQSPVPATLELKPGAQVMLLKNLHVRRGLVNGAVGRVLDLGMPTGAVPTPGASTLVVRAETHTRRGERAKLVLDSKPLVVENASVVAPSEGGGRELEGVATTSAASLQPRIELENGTVIEVPLCTWSVTLDDIGTITRSQIPLTLSWATTMHKAQGATLSHLSTGLSARETFAPGMAYVVLSRVKSLDRLSLHSFDPSAIQCDGRVLNFYNTLLHNMQQTSPNATTATI